MTWQVGKFKPTSFSAHFAWAGLISSLGPVAPFANGWLGSPVLWCVAAVVAGVLWEVLYWQGSLLLSHTPPLIEKKAEDQWPAISPRRKMERVCLELHDNVWCYSFMLLRCRDRRRPTMFDVLPFVLGAVAGLAFNCWRLG